MGQTEVSERNKKLGEIAILQRIDLICILVLENQIPIQQSEQSKKMAFQKAMLNEEAMRNFREFLEIYNKTTEKCFRQCVVDFNHRDVSPTEDKCINECTSKLVNTNHRILATFMEEQPRIIERKTAEAQKQQEEMIRQLEAQGIDYENLSPEEMAQRMMEGMSNNQNSQHKT